MFYDWWKCKIYLENFLSALANKTQIVISVLPNLTELWYFEAYKFPAFYAK